MTTKQPTSTDSAPEILNITLFESNGKFKLESSDGAYRRTLYVDDVIGCRRDKSIYIGMNIEVHKVDTAEDNKPVAHIFSMWRIVYDWLPEDPELLKQLTITHASAATWPSLVIYVRDMLVSGGFPSFAQLPAEMTPEISAKIAEMYCEGNPPEYPTTKPDTGETS